MDDRACGVQVLGGADALEGPARVVVELLPGDGALAVAVDDDVARPEPDVAGVPVEGDQGVRSSGAGEDGALLAAVGDVAAPGDGELDELEGRLDSFDLPGTAEEPRRRAQVHDVGVIEVRRPADVGGGERLGEARFLGVDRLERDGASLHLRPQDPSSSSNQSHCHGVTASSGEA